MSELERWESRYAGADYAFGKEPNYFLASCKGLLPRSGTRSGGRGRRRTQRVWLAEQGLDVLSIDFSPTALRKARALAAEHHVTVTFQQADVHTWAYPEASFDVVVEIFTQFSSPPERAMEVGGHATRPQARRSPDHPGLYAHAADLSAPAGQSKWKISIPVRCSTRAFCAFSQHEDHRGGARNVRGHITRWHVRRNQPDRNKVIERQFPSSLHSRRGWFCFEALKWQFLQAGNSLCCLSAHCFRPDAHGRSFTAPLGDVNERDNEEWQYPELQPQPKFQYPQYSQQSNSPNRRNRVQQFVIHLVPETATVRSCVVWLISIARSTDLTGAIGQCGHPRSAILVRPAEPAARLLVSLSRLQLPRPHASPIPGSSIPRKRSV